jgi:hypothetical protein
MPSLKTSTRILFAFFLFFCNDGRAYEFDPVLYARLYPVLPDWDHDGRLARNEAAAYELRYLKEERRYRIAILDTREFAIRTMEKQSPHPERLQSLRTDLESQRVSFKRWCESADRRREAILAGKPMDASAVAGDAIAGFR